MKKFLGFGLLSILLLGCSSSEKKSVPVFSLAWSEYPSWSVFGVAGEKGLIDPAEGKQGSVEKKWNVDIVLKEADYDTCITMYGSNACDAVCITNMDVLNPSLSRHSVVVLPTSTSDKADACVVVGWDGNTPVKDFLKGKKVYGLQKSVSEYVWSRNLEKQGVNPKDYQFVNMDPAAAATALQTAQKNIDAIMVWNPFVLQTLKNRQGTKVLFDSGELKEEVIDSVVVAQDVLKKEGGERFAAAVCDCYYQMNKMLADPSVGDDTLVALGAKFSSLGLEDMKVVVDQTKFYKTPSEAVKLITSKSLAQTMDKVRTFCIDNGIVSTSPSVGINVPWNTDKQLVFTTDFIKKVE